MKRLRITQFVRPPAVCHFAVTPLADVQPRPPHTHDFYELFWVEHGRGWHHVNQLRLSLRQGQAVLIRPTDAHSFSSASATPLVICNLAFAPQFWHHLARRYRPGWRDGFAPREITKRCFDWPDPLWGHWQWATEELRAGRRDRAALDRCLLNLQALLAGQPPSGAESAAPAWLNQAVAELNRPDIFRGGTKRFAALCGYSAEHVARSVRRHLRRTPTDLVNAARMTYAAGQLAATRQDIMRIALDCGFSSLSHFYHVFRGYHGISPRRYRRQQHRIIGMAD